MKQADEVREIAIAPQLLTDNDVVEEAISETRTENISSALLQEPFETSENPEPIQQAVVAPKLETNTTDVAAAESAIQASSETSTESLKETAAYGNDQQARPRYGHHPPPAYPRIARQRGWQGVVEYEVRVLPTGKVADLVLKSSSGYRLLDEAARKAIAQWRFSPATRSDTPIESLIVVPVEFVLDTL